MAQKFLRLIYRSTRGFLRLCVIATIMMGVGWLLEKALSVQTFSYLTHFQSEAFAAVESINPLQFKDRFVCAFGPSVEAINRKVPGGLYQLAVSRDCMYSLSLVPAGQRSPSNRLGSTDAPLPAPVVGHWAEGYSAPTNVVVAFVDTAWHLVIQPSVFAAFFSIVAFLLGGLISGILMSLPSFTWHPYVGAVVFCVGAIAAACLAAWGLQMLMEGGLYLFGRFTQIAGLCCGGAGITLFGYTLLTKTVEVRVHEGVDHLVPR